MCHVCNTIFLKNNVLWQGCHNTLFFSKNIVLWQVNLSQHITFWVTTHYFFPKILCCGHGAQHNIFWKKIMCCGSKNNVLWQTCHKTTFFSERELTFTFAICYRPSVCRLSVCLSVCNVRAPYSGGSNFPQYFYGIWYPSHPLTSTENFTEIVPGKPLRRGS